MDGKQVRGLAKIVELVYGKKLSKYNQESAWCQRPLRKGQLHYGALDAVSVLDILNKYRESDGADVELVCMTCLLF
jgi:ribonuclease D